MAKKKETTLDEVLQAVNSGFTGVQKQINGLDGRLGNVESDLAIVKTDIFELKTDMSEVKQETKGLRADIIWIKEILESNATDLKRLEEERIFTLNYVKRIERRIDFVKKHLKIA
jgi:chromosome segregation ATPase